jgi:hypothetical protein
MTEGRGTVINVTEVQYQEASSILQPMYKYILSSIAQTLFKMPAIASKFAFFIRNSR